MKMMKTKHVRFSKLPAAIGASLAIAALTMFAGSSVVAKNYVNWANEYYFNVPDDWRKIERFNVEEFLRLHGKNPLTVPHDAFFCPKDAEPFWSKAYLFVTSEKSENSFAMADTLLQGMAAEFDNMVKSQDSLGPITRVTSQKPKLDRKARTITQVSNLNVQGVDQVLRLVMKFHKSGTTTFYFYSRADLYKEYEPTFAKMVSSFSDENLKDAESSDSLSIVNVADVNASETDLTSDKSGDSTSGSGFSDFYNRYSTYIGMLFLVIAYVVYIRIRKKQGGG